MEKCTLKLFIFDKEWNFSYCSAREYKELLSYFYKEISHVINNIFIKMKYPYYYFSLMPLSEFQHYSGLISKALSLSTSVSISINIAFDSQRQESIVLLIAPF